MERGRQIVNGDAKKYPGVPLAVSHAELLPLIAGRKFWTDRGYDIPSGTYVYTLTIVLAEGEAAILDD
jgi:hypothetical protein